MILLIEEIRSGRLRGSEIEELEALALEQLRKIHGLRKYLKTPAIDRKIDREKRLLSRFEGVLYRRASLILMPRGGNRFEFIDAPTDAELEALEAAEATLEGPRSSINWAALEEGKR